jgi:hypothetical protein
VRIDTKREKNANGSPYDRILNTVASPLGPALPVSAPSSQAKVENPKPPAPSKCYAGSAPAADTIAETPVAGTPLGTVTVYHPGDHAIGPAQWDGSRRALRIAVTGRPVSLAFPLRLVGPSSAASVVTSDVGRVTATEKKSADYRTLSFIPPAGAKSVWIAASNGS